MTGNSDTPAIAKLEFELAAVLALVALTMLLIVRAEKSVKATRTQLRIERNRRVDAEDLAETRERSIDGVLETLKEANDRNESLAHRLASHERIPDPPYGEAAPAGSAGSSGPQPTGDQAG